MTIRRGEEWGRRQATPADRTVLRTDRAAHEWVVAQRERGEPSRPFGLGGGDLARTVAGGPLDELISECTMLPLDLVRVDARGRTTWSVAHVVARRSWWRGEVVLAMNAEFYGGADVAPRSHPNDGRVDVLRIDPTMPARARWQARRRASTGSHLPHPAITTTSVAHVELTFGRPLVVWVDGVRWTTTSTLTLTVEPDAYCAYI